MAKMTTKTKRLSASDVINIVAIHIESFPNSFLTKMGKPFLTEYYKAAIIGPYAIVVGLESDGSLVGFCSGSTQPSVFYSLLLKKAHTFFVPIALAVFHNPSIIVGIIQGFFRSLNSTSQIYQDGDCELSSLACVAEGKGFGSELVRQFMIGARESGAKRIYLTTDATDNDRVIKFYSNLGFLIDGTENRGHRKMLKLVCQIS